MTIFGSDTSDSLIRVIQALESGIISRAEARRILNVDSLLKSLDNQAPKKARPLQLLPAAYGSVIRVSREGVAGASTLVRDLGTWRYSSGQRAQAPRPDEVFDVIFDAGVTSDRNNNEEK